MMRRLIIVICMCFPLVADATSRIETLIGNLNATYQIRSDILTYINESVTPFSNSWKALVKIAQNQNFLYYHAKTYEEANKAVMSTSVAQRCLNMEYNGNNGYLLFKKIEMMMGDTNERISHIFSISHHFFGDKGFTHVKIKHDQLKNMCNSGDYG